MGGSQVVSFRDSKLPGTKRKYFRATVRVVEGDHFFVQFEGRDYLNKNYPVPQDKQGSWWRRGHDSKAKLIGPDRMLDRRDESTRVVVGAGALEAAVDLDTWVPTSPPEPPVSRILTSPPGSPLPLQSKKRSSDDSRIAAEALQAFKKPALGDGAAGGGGCGGCGGAAAEVLPELKVGSKISLLDLMDFAGVVDLTPTPGVVTCVYTDTFDYRFLDKKAALGSGKLLSEDVMYTMQRRHGTEWVHRWDFSAVTDEQRAEFIAEVKALPERR